jgi:MOSC domain-containing protein YiiM
VTDLAVPVNALLTGRVAPFARGEASAIAKSPCTGPVKIGFLGIEGDEQADPRHHGGPDKALHHYQFDHYAWWRDQIGAHPLLAAPGAFGENVSTLGLTEENVCIGDRFRLGTALIEISQGRQPCWKQAERLGVPTMVEQIVTSRRSGWYCRVLEAGVAQAGDMLALVDRPHAQWSVARVFGLLVGGAHKGERDALSDLAALDALFAGWRERAARLMTG